MSGTTNTHSPEPAAVVLVLGTQRTMTSRTPSMCCSFIWESSEGGGGGRGQESKGRLIYFVGSAQDELA